MVRKSNRITLKRLTVYLSEHLRRAVNRIAKSYKPTVRHREGINNRGHIGVKHLLLVKILTRHKNLKLNSRILKYLTRVRYRVLAFRHFFGNISVHLIVSAVHSLSLRVRSALHIVLSGHIKRLSGEAVDYSLYHDIVCVILKGVIKTVHMVAVSVAEHPSRYHGLTAANVLLAERVVYTISIHSAVYNEESSVKQSDHKRGETNEADVRLSYRLKGLSLTGERRVSYAVNRNKNVRYVANYVLINVLIAYIRYVNYVFSVKVGREKISVRGV